MKKIILVAAFALGFLTLHGTSEAQEVSFGMFYSSLAPYGQWVEAGGYGMCWRPVGIPDDWRPYTYGHWVWTDYGWTWISGYPWGWAPFHYGRWVFDSFYGWVWVPGYVWAPAWVEWRWGHGYCGWAPLPPGFHFRIDVVIGPNDRDFGVGYHGWNFVRADEMGRPRYNYLDRDAVPRVIGSTRNVTRLRFTSGGVYNEGLRREEVERVTRTRISTVNIYRTNELGHQRFTGNSVRIYSPAPFAPRFRDENTVIQRERSYQTPARYRTVQPQQRVIQPERTYQYPTRYRALQPQQRVIQREAPPARVRQDRPVPRVERQRQDTSVRPHAVQQRAREVPRPNEGNNKDKGPRRRH